MRLINADALLEHKVYAETPTISGDFVPGFVIDRAPTIDAVPVVRCKDCEWNDVCKDAGYYLGVNGFCSKGKKKDGEVE